MRTIAIIPARGGSKRFPGKNIFPWRGKPLIAYSIEACRKCPHIEDIFVSSDDEKILETAVAWGAKPLVRPAELADDQTPKIVAIRQAVQDPIVVEGGKPSRIVIAQANSPQLTDQQLNQAFDLMVTHNLWEVMSADANGVQNAAFRVVTYQALFNTFLSAHCGFVVAPNIDVHLPSDLDAIP
ncbi:MAG: hypothetical protein JNM00_07085 [Flavobacteriales bacterium]|nr:hypothetical protein [Flavobacteriales bacterium]